MPWVGDHVSAKEAERRLKRLGESWRESIHRKEWHFLAVMVGIGILGLWLGTEAIRSGDLVAGVTLATLASLAILIDMDYKLCRLTRSHRCRDCRQDRERWLKK